MTDQSEHPFAFPPRVERAGPTAAASVAQPAAPAVGERLHDWVVEHDDSKIFVVLYIGLAVVLSVWISPFWLVAVVAVHFAFELIRQQRRHAALRPTVLKAAWEGKLDVALVLSALVLVLYMEVVLGMGRPTGCGAVCLLLILGAPWLTSHSAASAASTLIAELHPLP